MLFAYVFYDIIYLRANRKDEVIRVVKLKQFVVGLVMAASLSVGAASTTTYAADPGGTGSIVDPGKYETGTIVIQQDPGGTGS